MEPGNGSDWNTALPPSDGNDEFVEWLLSGTQWVAFAADERGDVTWWNDRLAAVTGHDRTRLDGLPAAELFAIDPLEARDRLCGLLEASEQVVLPVRTADGGTAPHEFDATVLSDRENEESGKNRENRENGENRAYLYVGRPSEESPSDTGVEPLGTGDDVEELTRYRRIVETIRDGVFTLDGEWNLIDVNPPLASMLGDDPEALVGKHAAELIAPDGSVERAREAWTALQRGVVEEGTVQLTIQRTDGERFPAEIHYGRFPLSDGSTGAVGVVRDVTEREAREARLRDHRDQLARLNRIGDAAAAGLDPVLEAGSREEIERRVCERLADTDLYEVVWVGRPDGNGSVAPQATFGADARFHEVAQRFGVESGHERSAEEAFRQGEPVVRHEGWESEVGELIREAVDGTDLQMTMAIPLEYHGTTYGVLAAYSTREDAFFEAEREALARLGRAVGFAINAAGTRRLVHAHERTELEFSVGPGASVLAALSATVDAECALRWSMPATDVEEAVEHVIEGANVTSCAASPHDLWLRVAVEGAAAETVVAAAREVGVVDARVVDDTGTCCTVDLRTADSIPAAIVDAGAQTVRVVAEDGRARVAAEAPADADIRSVVEAFTERTDADLIAKRGPGAPADRDGGSLAETLTGKQREALRTARTMGYFEWPREHTAEEVAERLGVSSATLHYHLRAAQATLFDVVLEAEAEGTVDDE